VRLELAWFRRLPLTKGHCLSSPRARAKPPRGFATSKTKGHVTQLVALCLGFAVVQPQDFDEKIKVCHSCLLLRAV
jgi:hypothetical protein